MAPKMAANSRLFVFVALFTAAWGQTRDIDVPLGGTAMLPLGDYLDDANNPVGLSFVRYPDPAVTVLSWTPRNPVNTATIILDDKDHMYVPARLLERLSLIDTPSGIAAQVENVTFNDTGKLVFYQFHQIGQYPGPEIYINIKAPPPAVSSFNITDVGEDFVNVTFQQVEPLDSAPVNYSVEYREAGVVLNGGWNKTDRLQHNSSVKNLQTKVEGLSLGVRYNFRVVSSNRFGENYSHIEVAEPHKRSAIHSGHIAAIIISVFFIIIILGAAILWYLLVYRKKGKRRLPPDPEDPGELERLMREQQPGGEVQQPGGEEQQPAADGEVQQPGAEVQQPAAEEQQPSAEEQQPGREVQQPGAEVQQPDGEVQQPGAEVQQPGAEVQQPGAEVQHPGAELQQPDGELQQPGAEVQQPGAEVQHPGAELHQPGRGVQQPDGEVWQPGGEVQQPGAEVQQPGAEVQQPGAEVQQPSAEVQQPGGEVQQPDGEIQQPGAEVQQPGAEVQQPDAEVQQPIAEVQQAGAEVQQPGGEVQQPCAEVQQPGGEVQQPGAEVQQPGGEVQQPCAEVQQPGAEVQQPGAEVQQPGAEVQQPGAEVQQLGAELHQPGIEVQQPGGEVQQLGGEVQQPDGEVQQPGAEVQQPGAEVQQPGAEVQQPGAEVQQPGAEVQQPGAEVQQPGAEVQQPGAEEKHPSAEEQQPDGEAQQPDGEVQQPGAEVQQPGAEVQQPVGEAQQPDGEVQQPGAEVQQPDGEVQQPVGEVQQPDGYEGQPGGDEQQPDGEEGQPNGLPADASIDRSMLEPSLHYSEQGGRSNVAAKPDPIGPSEQTQPLPDDSSIQLDAVPSDSLEYSPRTYDVAVYYEKNDPDMEKVEEVIRLLENDSWSITVYDPHLKTEGDFFERYESSYKHSRHAIGFLTKMVLQYMKEKQGPGGETDFQISNFLYGILSSHDKKSSRKLIPIKLTNDKTPLILRGMTVLDTRDDGFKLKLFRSLSIPPGPNTPKLDQKMNRALLSRKRKKPITDEEVWNVASSLHIPLDVFEVIHDQHGGSVARLRAVVECWIKRYGEEATKDHLDEVLACLTEEPLVKQKEALCSTSGNALQEEACQQSPVQLLPSEEPPSMEAKQPMSIVDVKSGFTDRNGKSPDTKGTKGEANRNGQMANPGKSITDSMDDEELLRYVLSQSCEDDKSRKDNHERLEKRVGQSGLVFRDPVPMDGNCLFHAISDQLRRVGAEEMSHQDLRARAVEYLQNDPYTSSEEHMMKFVPDENWESYLQQMAKDGEYGDALVIFALANHLKRDIRIVSSVNTDNGDNFDVITEPTTGRGASVPLLLGHYAEDHYVSLDMIAAQGHGNSSTGQPSGLQTDAGEHTDQASGGPAPQSDNESTPLPPQPQAQPGTNNLPSVNIGGRVKNLQYGPYNEMNVGDTKPKTESGQKGNHKKTFQENEGHEKHPSNQWSGIGELNIAGDVENMQAGDHNVMNIPPQYEEQSLQTSSDNNMEAGNTATTNSTRAATEEDFQEIQEHVGLKWKDVAGLLSLSKGQIEGVDHDHKDLDEKVYQMLRKWKQLKGESATLAALTQALKQEDLGGVAQRLED